MPVPPSVLLVVGSPKLGSSASASLAAYLLRGLRRGGASTTSLHARRAWHSAAERAALLVALDQADILVLVFPLYEGNAPAIVVRLMELVALHRAAEPALHRLGLVVVENHGFPEPEQAATALGICRSFAAEARLEWLGALSLPLGAVLRERPLRDVPVLSRHARRALDTAALALAAGRPVPPEAERRMRRPMIPVVLFRFATERYFRRQMRCGPVLRSRR